MRDRKTRFDNLLVPFDKHFRLINFKSQIEDQVDDHQYSVDHALATISEPYESYSILTALYCSRGAAVPHRCDEYLGIEN